MRGAHRTSAPAFQPQVIALEGPSRRLAVLALLAICARHRAKIAASPQHSDLVSGSRQWLPESAETPARQHAACGCRLGGRQPTRQLTSAAHQSEVGGSRLGRGDLGNVADAPPAARVIEIGFDRARAGWQATSIDGPLFVSGRSPQGEASVMTIQPYQSTVKRYSQA